MLHKLSLIAFICIFLSACETVEGVKSGFGNINLGSWFSTSPEVAYNSCPGFDVSEELNTYFDLREDSSNFPYAKIQNMEGQCEVNEAGDVVTVSLDIHFVAMPAIEKNTPSDNLKDIEAPYFIAVIDERKEILAKDTFIIPFVLNKDGSPAPHTERLQQNLPISAEKDASSYTIIAGFQLNEQQLAYARTKQQMAAIMPASGNKIQNPDPFADH
jgi:hypothetical protein